MKYLAVSVALAVAVLSLAAPLEAQFCFRGHPKPQCNQFLITEAGYAVGAGDEWFGAGGEWFVLSELGFMQNLNERNALGGTVLLAIGEPEQAQVGLKVRYRRWLSRNLTLDASPGIILEHEEYKFKAPGFTGHVGIGYGDHLALTFLVQAIPLEGQDTEVRSYFGFRVGSYLGTAVHVLALVGVLTRSGSGEW